MKTLKYVLLILTLTVAATKAEAKIVIAEHMYMFGFSASFTDSTLYITDIQDVQGVSYESKTKFLFGRDSYSNQLKEFLAEKKGQPNRVCIVFFEVNKKKAEKKYQKLKKKYTGKDGVVYGLQYLSSDEFTFTPIVDDDSE